jgi:hypothetical protein
MNIYKLLLILFLPFTILSSCKKEELNEGMAIGLWTQVSVTEDGTEMTLAPEQEACKILIEANGICRYYHQAFLSYNNGDGPTAFYGTWSILDGQWINFTSDRWKFVPSVTSDSNKVVLSYLQDTLENGTIVNIIDTTVSVKKQWDRYHVQSRFTILQLTDDLMEIRIKTFEGEKKYAFLFAPNPEDFIEIRNSATIDGSYSPELVTDDNYWIIRKEFQTLKTFVFKFKRENY